MTTPPRIRMLDLNEWALVVAVRPWGHSELLTTNLNPADCAVALRDLAHVFDVVADELHGTQTEPDQDEAPEPPVEQPLVARGGRLDRERRTWTDGGGHVWDLSLTWADAIGSEWRWTGVLDRSGTPMMAVGGTGDRMPLDVVRALLGPIAPRGGEDA